MKAYRVNIVFVYDYAVRVKLYYLMNLLKQPFEAIQWHKFPSGRQRCALLGVCRRWTIQLSRRPTITFTTNITILRRNRGAASYERSHTFPGVKKKSYRFRTMLPIMPNIMFTSITVMGTPSRLWSNKGKTNDCRKQRYLKRSRKTSGIILYAILSYYYSYSTITNMGVLTTIYFTPPPIVTFYRPAWNMLHFVSIKNSETNITIVSRATY